MGKFEILEFLYRQRITGDIRYFCVAEIEKAVGQGDVRTQLIKLFWEGFLQQKKGENGWKKTYRIHPARIHSVGFILFRHTEEELKDNGCKG